MMFSTWNHDTGRPMKEPTMPDDLKAKRVANKKIRNQSDVIQRLPCLVAHLICESLGYFTPQSAANAIAYLPQRRTVLLRMVLRLGQQAIRQPQHEVRQSG